MHRVDGGNPVRPCGAARIRLARDGDGNLDLYGHDAGGNLLVQKVGPGSFRHVVWVPVQMRITS